MQRSAFRAAADADRVRLLRNRRIEVALVMRRESESGTVP
jgi:hypothetical protein